MVRKFLTIIMILALLALSGCTPKEPDSDVTPPDDGIVDTTPEGDGEDDIQENEDGTVTLPKVEF